MFSVNYLEKVIPFMENRSDKMFEQKYKKMFEIIERFLKTVKYIRLNNQSNDFLMKKVKKSYNLANILTIAGYNVRLKPVCANKFYSIFYDSAPICSFYQVPHELDFLFESKEVLSLKNQLIVIYQNIYNLTKYSSYEDNSSLKEIVRKNLEKKFEKKLLTFSEKNFLEKKEKIKSSKDLEEFCEKEDVGIFVGKKAFKYYLKDSNFFNFDEINLDFLPLEIISLNVSESIEKLKKVFGKDLSFEELNFPVFTDFGLKLTFLCSKNINIIIYNSAEYELIPLNMENLKIANEYVVMRFLLIQIFYMKMKKSDFEKEILFLELIHFLMMQKKINMPFEISCENLEKYYFGQYIDLRILFSEICEKEKDYTPFEKKAANSKFYYF